MEADKNKEIRYRRKAVERTIGAVEAAEVVVVVGVEEGRRTGCC